MLKSNLFSKILLALIILSFLVVLILLILGMGSRTGPFVVAFFAALGLYFMRHPVLKNFAFTVWVFAFVSASMYYPPAFGTWFGQDLAILIVPLIQIIMFGMGTTLSVTDFKRILKMPYPVLVGFFLQFAVMPIVGFSIAMLFRFEPEIAAGVILTGSVPGGVASNLMAYLAGGNVALSVTMTSCSTMISPVMTPFLMKVLAGRLVPIDFVSMMLSIINMIIVPIVAGLVANKILYSKSGWANRFRSLAIISVLSILMAYLAFIIPAEIWGDLLVVRDGTILGFILIGVVALAKIFVTIVFKGPENWMDKTLPLVSMVSICFIIAIITARSSEKLATVGLLLIGAAILHNAIGYTFGYWLSRLLRLKERDCRTVAFEVGMQNGGMASGLAMNVLKSASAALAPAIFGPWMNISGSMLANWWHRKTLSENSTNDNKKENNDETS